VRDDSGVAAESTVERAHRQNCEAPPPRRGCAPCGQRATRGRLPLRGLWGEFAQQFLALDRGLWFTVVQLTIRPGDVIRRYLAGQRRRFVGPVSYLFFATALLLVVTQLLLGDRDVERYRASVSYMTEPGRREALMSPRQADAYARLMYELSQYMTAMTVAMAVPFSVALWRVFRRAGINLAESAVFALYAFGHACVLYVPLEVISATLTGGAIGGRAILSMLVYLVVCVHAAFGLFGPSVRTVVRVSAAFAMSYLAFAIPLGYGVVAYIVRTVPR
jgi:hypothetical protein